MGQFVSGGSASVVPDLSGKIPNPIPGWPDLAIVDITGMRLQFTSPPFAIDAAGAWTTMATVTVLEGTLKVTPLVGSPSTTDLAGTSGDPTVISGHFTQSGPQIHAVSPQASTFVFTDPGSGITGTIDLSGTLTGDYDCVTPATYCTAAPNSTGMSAEIGWSGSSRIQDNAFTISASQLPANKWSYFFMSPSEGFVPNFGGSEGNLCVGAPIIRFNANVLNTGSTGAVSLTLDLQDLPQATVVQPGDELNFQLWYRDNNPGSTSNTTEAMKVVWCP